MDTQNSQLNARRNTTAASILTLAALGGLAVSPTTMAADITFADSSFNSENGIREANGLSSAFRNVAKTLQPSVVSIVTKDKAPYANIQNRTAPGFSPNRPMFPNEQVPGNTPPLGDAPDRMGQGTGVIVSDDGFVITNNHVIEGADEVVLTLADGRELNASVVGADTATDLALLKVEADGLTSATFGDSKNVEVGDWVVALGSPFGLKQTLTAGIVSAMERNDVGLATFENYIQTDAAINPGNSGGPLANIRGEVIGINSAISSRTGGNDGIGFAIPSRMVQRVANDLMEDGSVSRGWLGVGIQPLDQDLASSFGYDGNEGVLVTSVIPETAAEKAGVRAGDIIVDINEVTMSDPQDLAMYIAEFDPNSTVTLTLAREGRIFRTPAILSARPKAPNAGYVTPVPTQSEDIGLSLIPLTSDLATQAELNGAQGLFVQGVAQESPAARSGLQPGDLILQVNGAELKNIQDFDAALELGEFSKARMLVERRGMTRFIVLERLNRVR